MAETDHRFGGIARLYGRAAADKLLNSRVAVVGIGGVGSWAAEALARSGIGSLTLVDLDEICVSNVNRQLHAMDGTFGKQKAEVMAARVRMIHPGCEVVVVPRFFTAASAGDILDPGFGAVLDAIDTTRHKALLLASCLQRGIPAVTCGGAGGRRDPTRIRVADLAHAGRDPLLAQTRKCLREHHRFPKIPQNTKPPPFGIDAVFSDEAPVFVQCDGETASTRPPGTEGRLGCANGLGTAAHVTATFGMVAAARVIETLLAPFG